MRADSVFVALVTLAAAGYLFRRWRAAAKKGGVCDGCCGCGGDAQKKHCEK